MNREIPKVPKHERESLDIGYYKISKRLFTVMWVIFVVDVLMILYLLIWN